MSHLNLFCCFYLAWFKLPSSLLHFALNPEQLCKATPGHAPALGWQAPATGEFEMDFEMVCETPHHVLLTSRLLLPLAVAGMISSELQRGQAQSCITLVWGEFCL